jgi:hypothetical protein
MYAAGGHHLSFGMYKADMFSFSILISSAVVSSTAKYVLRWALGLRRVKLLERSYVL